MTEPTQSAEHDEHDGIDLALQRITRALAGIESAAHDTTPKTVAEVTTAGTLRQFTSGDYRIHASPDGRLAALHNRRTWIVIDTGSGEPLRGALATHTGAHMDRALQRLSELPIPWGDVPALSRRWAIPTVKTADQLSVLHMLTGPGPAGGDDGAIIEWAITLEQLASAYSAENLPAGFDPVHRLEPHTLRAVASMLRNGRPVWPEERLTT